MFSPDKKKFVTRLVLPITFSSFAYASAQAAVFPVAVADSYTATSGQTIEITPLVNDTGEGLFIEEINSPRPYGSGDTVLVNGSTLTYTAPDGFVGTTEFNYGIKDVDGQITSALITVEVAADPGVSFPVTVADSATTTKGQPITIDVLANDSGSNLFIEEIDSPRPYGTGTNAIVNNKVVYTPPADFIGTSQFHYGVKDSVGQINSAEVTITVTEPVSTSPWPTAGADYATTTSGTSIYINPLWNDTGSGLRVTDVNSVTTSGGSVSIDNNQLVFTPSVYSKGDDSFWYQITDDQGRTNAAKVTVTVNSSVVDMGPYPTAGSDVYTVNKNSSGNVFAVFANDTGSGLAFHETYAYSQKGGKTAQTDTTIVYSAPAEFVGTDEFWYAMKDTYGRTNAAKVIINVVDNEPGANTDPDAVEDIYQRTINGAETRLNVLANDVDADGDTLKVESVGSATFGSVRLTNTGRVLYTPPSIPVSDSFVYVISDGNGGIATAVATISVTDPNDGNVSYPTITGEFVTVAPGATVIIRVLENDFDSDGDTLVLDQVTSGSQGGTAKVVDNNGELTWVEYTALQTASGTDEFYYGVHDGRGLNGSGKVIITFE
jgi:hypothetical protein